MTPWCPTPGSAQACGNSRARWCCSPAGFFRRWWERCVGATDAQPLQASWPERPCRGFCSAEGRGKTAQSNLSAFPEPSFAKSQTTEKGRDLFYFYIEVVLEIFKKESPRQGLWFWIPWLPSDIYLFNWEFFCDFLKRFIPSHEKKWVARPQGSYMYAEECHASEPYREGSASHTLVMKCRVFRRFGTFSIQLAGAVCGISYCAIWRFFFIAKLSFIPSRNDLSFAVTPEL